MNSSLSATRLCRLMLVLSLGAASLGVTAQQLGDLEKKSALSDADRAKRDADKVFQWIKFNADKAPAKPAAPAPAPARPAAPVAKAAPRHEAPAPSPKAEELQNKPEPAVAAVAASPAPEPVQLATASPKLTPPPPAAVAAPAPAPEPEPEVALKLINKVEPEIPRQLLSSVRNGLVVVKFTVEPNGSVKDAEAIKSSHRKLSVAAIDAVNQWRFAPIPRSREVSVEIGFQAE